MSNIFISEGAVSLKTFTDAAILTSSFSLNEEGFLAVVDVYEISSKINPKFIGEGLVLQLQKFYFDYLELKNYVLEINELLSFPESKVIISLIKKASTMFYLLKFIEYEFYHQGYSDILLKQQQYQLPNFSNIKVSNAT
jgi:hypothetical protein